MHNNYHFIKYLSAELQPLLVGSVLMECYSQNKDELVLSFLGEGRQETHIIANLGSEFSCLYFPKEYHRAKKNSITLFNEIIGLKVTSILQVPNERLFVIDFSEGFRLAFKLYGNRGNILLFREKELISIFKNNLRQDKNFILSNEGRKVEVSYENFLRNEESLKKMIFTLGDVPEYIVQQKGYDGASPENKFRLIQELLRESELGIFYITRLMDKVVLSVVRAGEVISTHSSAIEAINTFYHAHFKFNYLEKLKTKVLSVISAKVKAGNSYLEKNRQKLQELRVQFPLEKIADILMANLHAIPAGSEKITLYDFYRDQQLEITLNKELSPQKYAETLYKKSKKRPAEIQRLEQQIETKEKELANLEKERSHISELEFHKDLEPYVQKYILAPEKEQEEPVVRFKEYEYMGYKIYVGRSAENNDELTQKFAHKDDLWLHAKDVTGSHVIIKYRSGQNFPKNVIERAASIAAFYSKRKNDSLCPVIYTPKKYVRKIKGAPKGAVKVERESVILVEPRDF